MTDFTIKDSTGAGDFTVVTDPTKNGKMEIRVFPSGNISLWQWTDFGWKLVPEAVVRHMSASLVHQDDKP